MKRNIGAELAARMTLVNEMLANGESVEAIGRGDVDSPQAVASEAEIDALEYVVEEGRIACHEDYGVLRSWLCRLRPAWKSIHSEEATPGECTSHGGCTLTDAEREAIERGIDSLLGVEDMSAGAGTADDAAACLLRSLLERLK
jgi:hypothetical protein